MEARAMIIGGSDAIRRINAAITEINANLGTEIVYVKTGGQIVPDVIRILETIASVTKVKGLQSTPGNRAKDGR